MNHRPSLLVKLLVLLAVAMLPPPSSASDGLTTTIRASNCVANATHCHCAMVDAKSDATCLKPVADSVGMCFKASCSSGFRCDCESSSICVKKNVTGYTTTDTSASTNVACTTLESLVPKSIVGHTSDFHIVAFQEFQLFVNNEQIGYGESNDYRVFTAEITAGDVVAVMAKRRSKDVYGVKLRFEDVQLETRVIDENWYSSSTYDAAWLDSSFDPVATGWVRPSTATTVHDVSFDKDVPWMWHGTSETVYMRYRIP